MNRGARAILIVAAVGIGAVAIAIAMRPRGASAASPFDVFRGSSGSPGMTIGPNFENIRNKGGGGFGGFDSGTASEWAALFS